MTIADVGRLRFRGARVGYPRQRTSVGGRNLVESKSVREVQPRGLTMNHSTNSAQRSSSSKRNVQRFQKKSPFV